MIELRRFARKLDADEETRPASRFNACQKASRSEFRAPAEALVLVCGISRGRLRGVPRCSRARKDSLARGRRAALSNSGVRRYLLRLSL
jgi:hypothetical protein